jgi:hypothetical protein
MNTDLKIEDRSDAPQKIRAATSMFSSRIEIKALNKSTSRR